MAILPGWPAEAGFHIECLQYVETRATGGANRAGGQI
jgi:hypothetical protein